MKEHFVDVCGRERKLLINAAAIMRVEAMYGPDAISGGKMGLSSILALLWAGLLKDDPDLRHRSVVKWYDELEPKERKTIYPKVVEAVTKAYLDYQGQDYEDDEIGESAAQHSEELEGKERKKPATKPESVG